MRLSATRRLFRGAAIAAAALALIASAASPSAAATRNLYQVQINLNCNVYYCTGLFPTLAANEKLELDKVICTFRLEKTHYFNEAHFSYAESTVPGGYFHLDMHIGSRQGGVNGVYTYVVEQSGPFVVPHSKQLKAGIYASGGPPSEARCSVFGEKVIYNS